MYVGFAEREVAKGEKAGRTSSLSRAEAEARSTLCLYFPLRFSFEPASSHSLCFRQPLPVFTARHLIPIPISSCFWQVLLPILLVFDNRALFFSPHPPVRETDLRSRSRVGSVRELSCAPAGEGREQKKSKERESEEAPSSDASSRIDLHDALLLVGRQGVR